MSTLIAFSGQADDHVTVEEEINQVNARLQAGGDPFVHLTSADTEPKGVYVNPARVAYVKSG